MLLVETAPHLIGRPGYFWHMPKMPKIAYFWQNNFFIFGTIWHHNKNRKITIENLEKHDAVPIKTQ